MTMRNDGEATTFFGRLAAVLQSFDARRMFLGVFALVFSLLVLVLSGQFFEHLDAEQIMVIQAPLSGRLAWHINAGVKWQGFGKVTKYPKRFQYWFSNSAEQG